MFDVPTQAAIQGLKRPYRRFATVYVDLHPARSQAINNPSVLSWQHTSKLVAYSHEDLAAAANFDEGDCTLPSSLLLSVASALSLLEEKGFKFKQKPSWCPNESLRSFLLEEGTIRVTKAYNRVKEQQAQAQVECSATDEDDPVDPAITAQDDDGEDDEGAGQESPGEEDDEEEYEEPPSRKHGKAAQRADPSPAPKKPRSSSLATRPHSKPGPSKAASRSRPRQASTSSSVPGGGRKHGRAGSLVSVPRPAPKRLKQEAGGKGKAPYMLIPSDPGPSSSVRRSKARKASVATEDGGDEETPPQPSSSNVDASAQTLSAPKRNKEPPLPEIGYQNRADRVQSFVEKFIEALKSRGAPVPEGIPFNFGEARTSVLMPSGLRATIQTLSHGISAAQHMGRRFRSFCCFSCLSDPSKCGFPTGKAHKCPKCKDNGTACSFNLYPEANTNMKNWAAQMGMSSPFRLQQQLIRIFENRSCLSNLINMQQLLDTQVEACLQQDQVYTAQLKESCRDTWAINHSKDSKGSGQLRSGYVQYKEKITK
ncbi:hypothetical protein V5O48_009660 [Marasmius crinis-equi]|uniref:Zn(2)-C6 fungal-type domain-containing protein n=1 Tax=Marasmius crinis-equi TaxID=585013 RepID=A0ABR3FAQ9_9AGAR